MRASLLQAREPFGEILAGTVARFWEQQLQRSFHGTYEPAGGSQRHAEVGGRQLWWGNLWLNAFFRPHVQRDALEPTIREFSHSPIAWRRPWQRAYVRWALSSWGAPWLAHAVLWMEPAVPDAEQWLIVPGNNKIRFLHRAAGRAYSVAKAGFPHAPLQREIAARAVAGQHGVPVPKLYETAADGSWFAEQYISATPLNRLVSRRQRLALAGHAIDDVLRMTRATSEWRDAAVYIQARREQIGDRLARLTVADGALRNRWLAAADQLAEQALRHAGARPLGVGWTHGDFQGANLLCQRGQFVVIDWEFADRRQAGFDVLTWDLNARQPCGLAERLVRFVHAGPAASTCAADVAVELWPDRSGRAASAWLFLLEQLLLDLEQCVGRPLTSLPTGLQLLSAELQSAIRLAERLA